MAKWLTIIVAVIGLGVGIYTAATARQILPILPPAQQPSVNPFPHAVAGTGLVEASTRNIGVAAPDPGLVVEVYKQVGDKISVGTPLFQLDTRPLDAERVRAEAALASSQAELTHLKAKPRLEDLPPLEAAVQQAQSLHMDRKDDYDRALAAERTGGANPYEVIRKKFAMETSAAELRVAQANLDRIKAGAWSQEIAVTQSKVDMANADLDAIRIRAGRMTVKSPVDGNVIKRNINPGEYASSTPVGQGGGSGANRTDAPMVVGDISQLHIRAQIDEADMPLVRPGAKGSARMRGSLDVNLPLTMIRIEPMAMPKTHLTGLVTEMVDTRVVEVIFRVDDLKGVSIYPGQLVDVYVETPPK